MRWENKDQHKSTLIKLTQYIQVMASNVNDSSLLLN